MGLFTKDVNDRLKSHIDELEHFELMHVGLLPKGWIRVKPIIVALKKIDEQSIKDLIRLHKQNSDDRLYSKVMPLLLSLHRDLQDMLTEIPTLDDEKKETKILSSLIDEIKNIITNDEWKDKALISKINSSDLIYRRNEDTNLAMMRYLVLADQFKIALSKRLGIDNAWHYILPLARDQFIRLYREVYVDVGKLPQERIKELVYHPENIGKAQDKNRIWRFQTAKWTVKNIHIKDMGVWPAMGETDIFTTSGNLPDTAIKIFTILHGKAKEQPLSSRFRYPNRIIKGIINKMPLLKVNEWPPKVKPHIPDDLINSIYSIRHYADIIYRLFPIIIMQRGKLTRRVIKNNETKKQFGFSYKVTKYDIDDGSHRALAFALLGIKRLKCFVGSSLYNSKAP